jgi:glycosyltransferase involved in cell wall biosynthesis
MTRPAPTTELERPGPSSVLRLSDAVRGDFAVVVPALNESENIPDLVRELRATFEKHGLSGEVLLVDDGSRDDTAARALAEAKEWPNLRVIRHRRNFGKTEALVTAAAETNATWLVLFDADLQHSTEEIPRFLEKLDEGFDIVTGRKVGRYEKRAVSSIYNRLSRSIFEVPVSDTNSMKAFRRDILDEVRLRHDWHRFFVVLAYARGFSITEIDIALLPRRHGEAKYSGKGRIVVGFLDMLSVWFFLFFSRKPMMLFGVSGLILVSVGIIIGVVISFLRIMSGDLGPDSPWFPPFGYRPWLTLIMMLEVVGVLLFGVGFVAEQVAQQNADIDALHRNLSKRNK